MKAPKEPKQPIMPREPEEYFDRQLFLKPNWGETWTIKDLESHLPAGKTLNDIRFNPEEDDSSYSSGSYVSISCMVKEQIPNYKSAMIVYRRHLKEFNLAMKQYKKEYDQFLKEKKVYDSWNEIIELKALKKRVAQLESKQSQKK